MLTVEEALEQILSRITPLGTELVELTAALGRVLAEPTVSCRELPPWPNSSMDGYAVRADDTRAGGVELGVVGRIIAGSLPAGTLRPGQIPNTNTYSLMAQALEAGAEPVSLGVVPDRLEAIVERVRWAAWADVLVSSAGVSVGELDLVREALVKCGAELHLWKVAMRPGKPITFGSLEGRPVFGLPGNPVSAMVTFELFVRPALRKMAGSRAIDRPRVWARALEAIRNPGGRRGYLRVTLARDGREYGAKLTGDQGSAILKSMVRADGLAVVAPDTIVPAGDRVEVIVLRALEPRVLGG